MSENTNEQPAPPIKLAFVIDNKVVDVLHTHENLYSILLNNPVMINVTGENGEQTVWVNDIYNPETNSFSRPEGALEEAKPNQPMPPVKVAFVLNNIVVEVLHTDERLGAIFLSDPLIINVTNEDGNQTAFYGDSYDPETQSFISLSLNNPDNAVSSEDGFIDEQVGFKGWIYDETLGHDVPPIPYPTDGKLYNWDNTTINWIEAIR